MFEIKKESKLQGGRLRLIIARKLAEGMPHREAFVNGYVIWSSGGKRYQSCQSVVVAAMGNMQVS